MLIPDTVDLARNITIGEMCDDFKKGAEEVRQALELLATAKNRMGQHCKYFHLWPQALHDHALDGELKIIGEVLRDTVRQGWAEILNRSGVMDAMTSKRRDELEKKLRSDTLPELTVENVLAFVDGLRGSMPNLLAESIAEAARILRPTRREYKTNGDGWALGRKVVLRCMVDANHGSMHPNYHREGELSAVENAFSLLDGKGPARHPFALASAMRDAMAKRINHCETPYFRAKWFQNGNLHLEFLRLDLVDKLNAAAADHFSLRGAGA